jgi:hypothetical protein
LFKLSALRKKGFPDKIIALAMFPRKKGNNFPRKREKGI